MMKNNHVNSFRAVVIRLVLILVIFFFESTKIGAENLYFCYVISIFCSNLNYF